MSKQHETHEVVTVKDLRRALETIPKHMDNKLVVNQVVGQQSGAWNMELALTRINDMLVLTTSHRDMHHLPMHDGLFIKTETSGNEQEILPGTLEYNDRIDRMIAELQGLKVQINR